MFFTLFGCSVGGGGSPKGRVHNLLMQFFTPDSSKIEVFETYFFDIVTTQNDHPSYESMFWAVFTCLSPYLGIRSGGGGAPKGRVHNLLMQFFTPDSSKMEVFETCFCDIVIPQNDHPRYVKHVLGRIYVFFTPFGY